MITAKQVFGLLEEGFDRPAHSQSIYRQLDGARAKGLSHGNSKLCNNYAKEQLVPRFQAQGAANLYGDRDLSLARHRGDILPTPRGLGCPKRPFDLAQEGRLVHKKTRLQ